MSRVSLVPRRAAVLALVAVCVILAACQTDEPAFAGPACPATAPPEAGGALKPTNIMVFDGISFGRRFGDAECEYLRKGGRGAVCRFTSPAVLEVKTEAGTYVFAPGIGQSATVSVRQGVASCVLTPKSQA